MKKAPHWICHTHLLSPDSYECSVCGGVTKKKTAVCPYCKTTLRSTEKDLGWVDEAEEWSLLLDDGPDGD